MSNAIGLVPLLPLLSSLLLMIFGARLTRSTITLLGVGSVGAAALATATLALSLIHI